ncbi:MAG: hypothetical protein R2750_08560 [Bacteroidales bacterium]
MEKTFSEYFPGGSFEYLIRLRFSVEIRFGRTLPAGKNTKCCHVVYNPGR